MEKLREYLRDPVDYDSAIELIETLSEDEELDKYIDKAFSLEIIKRNSLKGLVHVLRNDLLSLDDMIPLAVSLDDHKIVKQIIDDYRYGEYQSKSEVLLYIPYGKNYNLETLRYILYRPDIDVGFSSEGDTGDVLAALNEDLDALKLYLTHPDFDINHGIELNDETLLMKYLINGDGNLDIVKAIIDYGYPKIDLKYKGVSEYGTPYDIAKRNKYNNIVDYLEPFYKTENNIALVEKYAMNGDLIELEEQLEKSCLINYINCTLSTNQTILMKVYLGCETNKKEVMELLLKYEADPNITDNNKMSVLMYACEHNRKDIVELLLENKANPNLVSKRFFSNNALMIACDNQNIEIIKLLLKYGADKTMKDYLNRTPYDISILKKNREIMNLVQ